jgi:DNA-directed RNA polymerase subunit F
MARLLCLYFDRMYPKVIVSFQECKVVAQQRQTWKHLLKMTKVIKEKRKEKKMEFIDISEMEGCYLGKYYHLRNYYPIN